MRQDAENAKDSLGKTAYYDPAEKLIVLYVTNRHPKDVLRSFSHELVHHAQNCRGDLDDLSTDGNYAGSGKGREMEGEAYLLGNGFLVRDWEDSIKYKGVNEMKLTKKELFNIVEELVNEMKKPEEDEVPGGEPGKESSLEEQGVPDIDVEKIAQDAIKELEQLDAEVQELVLQTLHQVIIPAQLQALANRQGGDQKRLASKKPAQQKEPEKLGLDRELEEISPVPTPIPSRDEEEDELDENNDTWYNSSLYESLKSKWTK